jgi:rod shape-determining protein MreC
MRGLFRFLQRNYAFLLFLFLEVVSLLLVFNYNSFQKSQFLNSSNCIAAKLYNTTSSVLQYFELTTVNKQLAEENARLNQLVFNTEQVNDIDSVLFITGTDSCSVDSIYRVFSAKIINNSVNKQQNYITLNKGRKDGIKPEQGILAPGGIVGVITSVSESYSTGLSLLNPRWSVSAKLKDTGYYGALEWNGKDYREAKLLEIPFHVKLAVGDTVVTSGYSMIFPEGLLIGTVKAFEQLPGENYYDIDVCLAVDFKSIRYVQVLDNTKRNEIKELEESAKDE